MVHKTVFILAALTGWAFSMSHNEAIQRCETRVSLLKGQSERLMDDSFRGSLKKIMDDMAQTLQKLRGAKTAQEIFALSNDCHNGARSAEWIVERYGKQTPAGLQNSAIQKPLDPAPQVESLLTNAVVETPKPAEKSQKGLSRKVGAKKSSNKPSNKFMRAKHRTSKRIKAKATTPMSA